MGIHHCQGSQMMWKRGSLAREKQWAWKCFQDPHNASQWDERVLEVATAAVQSIAFSSHPKWLRSNWLPHMAHPTMNTSVYKDWGHLQNRVEAFTRECSTQKGLQVWPAQNEQLSLCTIFLPTPLLHSSLTAWKRQMCGYASMLFVEWVNPIVHTANGTVNSTGGYMYKGVNSQN